MTAPTSHLDDVVLEIERHAAASGWDQPATVFALVETTDLLAREPQLAALLGVEGDPEPGVLTPVEQETSAEHLQELLATILWPPEVAGCAVVLEATTESSADGGGEEARIVAGALRGGQSCCAIRQRAHDQDDLVMVGPDLVPGLLELLHATLDDDGDAHPHDVPDVRPDEQS